MFYDKFGFNWFGGSGEIDLVAFIRRGPVVTGQPACVDSNHSPRFLYQSEVLTSHFSVNHLENALWQVDKSDPVCVMIILLIKANVCLSLLGMRLQKPRARLTAGVVP